MRIQTGLVYLFCMALMTGLILVHLHTQHIQSVNEIVRLTSVQRQLQQQIQQQQVQLSRTIESPKEIKEHIDGKEEGRKRKDGSQKSGSRMRGAGGI